MIRSRMQFSVITLLVAFILTVLIIPSWPFSGDRETRHLFTIQRSKNVNIVQYDAQLTPAGKLDPKEPVIAYWIMLAEDGRKKELMWIEKEMAYGFKAKCEANGDFAILDMVADIRRTVKIYETGGRYRAETVIDGKAAFVEKIYVKSVEGNTLPRVEYVELSGEDIETGSGRYEKLVPSPIGSYLGFF
jgi:hypothetical protein